MIIYRYQIKLEINYKKNLLQNKKKFVKQKESHIDFEFINLYKLKIFIFLYYFLSLLFSSQIFLIIFMNSSILQFLITILVRIHIFTIMYLI